MATMAHNSTKIIALAIAMNTISVVPLPKPPFSSFAVTKFA